MAAIVSGSSLGLLNSSLYVLGSRGALGQAPQGFSAATKFYCTAYEQAVADFVGRVFGPDAVLGGDLARGIAYAPAYTIMGGTSGVLHNVIGERILGLPR